MRKHLFLLFGGACLASPAMAQEKSDAGEGTIVLHEGPRDTLITVVASGDDDLIQATGQNVTILGTDEIARVQGPDIVRVLERAPGVTASRNGGLGGFTGVRVRGAEAEQLLVLIDGARMGDPGSPGGGFDFGNLLPYGMGKIELLRGSNSTIWGSQAIGGVLAVTSTARRGVAGSAEYGAHDTLAGSLEAGTNWRFGHAAVDAAIVDSDGFSTAAAGSEPDAFRQWQVGGRVAHIITQGLTLNASGRFGKARADIDGFPAPDFTLADTPEFQRSRQASGRIGARAILGELELDGGFSLADTWRAQYDPTYGTAPSFETNGRSERAELRGRWELSPPVSLRFGAEREWSRFDSTFDAEQKAAITGAYAQLGYTDGRLSANAGLRRDDHSRFGGEWSVGADARWRAFGSWAVHASYGEGFKAPTLFQLFSDFGNTRLEPERSRSLDIGFGTGDRNLPAHFDLTVFRRDTRGLIGFISCFMVTDGICTGRPFGTYDNIARARAQGVELEGGFRPLPDLGLSAAYAYVEAEDRTPGSANAGNALPRRPRHALTLTGEWQPAAAVKLAADLRVASHSFDDAANAVRMRGYEVLTLRASWDLSDRVSLFGRVENAGDEDYQTAAGYATAGRSAYLGARARW
jgi:vitamin B12 transporter